MQAYYSMLGAQLLRASTTNKKNECGIQCMKGPSTDLFFLRLYGVKKYEIRNKIMKSDIKINHQT